MTSVEPFKVGFLDEGLFADAAVFDRSIGDTIRMRFDEALAVGEVDRPIELIVRTGRGLPSGTAKAVQDAWRELADEGVLVIIGPGITDNCMAVVPLFEAHGVPTINFPGTTRSRGRYGFHYQLGSLYDDGPLIVRAMARRGLHQVAVIRDRSPIGEEFFEFFEEECERHGLAVGIDLKSSPVAEDLSHEVKRAKESGPDALAYLGFGGVLLTLSRALTSAGWDPPRFTTSAGMHFHSQAPEDRRQMSGWVYVDQVDEGNHARCSPCSNATKPASANGASIPSPARCMTWPASPCSACATPPCTPRRGSWRAWSGSTRSRRSSEDRARSWALAPGNEPP